jgi:hypothetical protein
LSVISPASIEGGSVITVNRLIRRDEPPAVALNAANRSAKTRPASPSACPARGSATRAIRPAGEGQKRAPMKPLSWPQITASAI